MQEETGKLKLILVSLKLSYTKQEYDDEPVLYCEHCLSLGIASMNIGLDTDYCINCGNTEISETSLSNWITLNEQRENNEVIKENNYNKF